MQWDRDSIAGVESYFEPQTRATVVRSYNHRDEKVVLDSAAYRFTGLKT